MGARDVVESSRGTAWRPPDFVASELRVVRVDDFVMERSHLRAALGSHEIAAVIFDVDGTMYDQARVRRTMVWRILKANALRPAALLRTVRTIQAYRHAQEELRSVGRLRDDLVREQRRRAAERLGIDVDAVTRTVERWMEREPLDVVGTCVRTGLREFLQEARSRGLRLGVVSDYPAAAKLEAMGFAHLFDAVVTAQDREVQRLKPDPRGITVALERLAVASEGALYVGDRKDIDPEAAMRAHVRCVLIGGDPTAAPSTDYLSINAFRELSDAIYG